MQELAQHPLMNRLGFTSNEVDWRSDNMGRDKFYEMTDVYFWMSILVQTNLEPMTGNPWIKHQFRRNTHQ